MSASREKKTRQVSGQDLNEKQIKAQQEAAQAKRNSVIYTIIGVVCAIAVAALLIWNSGLIQNRADAVSIDGETYSVGDVQYYYNQILNQYYMYSQWGIDNGYDFSVPADEQMYDEEAGVTWHDQILNEALTGMAQTKALVALAKEEGFELSHDGAHSVEDSIKSLINTSAQNGYTTVNSYLKAAFGRSMNKAKYEALLTESQLAYEFQQAHADALEYTDEELEAHYAEHKDDMDQFRFNSIFFDAAMETDEPTEDELKVAEEKAQALKAELESGKDFAAAVEQYSEDASVSIRQDYTQEGANLDGTYAEWMISADRKAGDLFAMVDGTETGWYVVEFLGREREDEISGDIRHILVAADQDEGATVPTEEQYEAAKAKAEALLEQWKSGEATEDSFAELAKTESADPGSAANGGLYEEVSSASGFIADFADWATDPQRQPGDTGLVKNTASSTKGWHIMYFVGQNDPLWKVELRQTMADEDTTKWLEELETAAEVTRLDGLKNVK